LPDIGPELFVLQKLLLIKTFRLSCPEALCLRDNQRELQLQLRLQWDKRAARNSSLGLGMPWGHLTMEPWPQGLSPSEWSVHTRKGLECNRLNREKTGRGGPCKPWMIRRGPLSQVKAFYLRWISSAKQSRCTTGSSEEQKMHKHLLKMLR
jgi:hypothetical protein